ncbi:MAG: Stp1/IreP family PP2C-type Ser/Thr phosphatase [Lachnospiraceae bacterium]|nr:Stp1/IreP family PP2C-type Ser/Thr phosphatase [Lachnospiraceae bacterium]
MKTVSRTDTGRRREMNQDYVYTSETPVGNLPNLFILADGMGGHNAGDYASRYTVEMIVDFVRNSSGTSPITIIREAIQQANQAVMEKAQTDIDLEGMGTTVVVATVQGQELCVANVGDSRLYLAGQDFRQITKDHSYVQEMVRRGEISKEVARIHPDRNIITRAVGGWKEIEVDFFELDLKEGDRILICSDGLTDMLEDQEIFEIIQEQQDMTEALDLLIERANEYGGNDNITIILTEPFSGEVKIC